jgi:DNA-directed RNA polymerase
VYKDVTFSVYKELNKELFEEFNVDNFNARVGGYFVFCLWQVKLLYQDIETIPDFTPKTQYYYRVVEEVRKIFINNNQRVFHLPMKLPMVCEPKDYLQTDKGLKLGGYLLNDVCYTDGVFKKKIGYGIETELKQNNIIISLINGLSKTPYKINLDTLQYVIKYGLEKGILLDVSSNKFQKFLDNPYKGFNKDESKKYRSLYSKLILERNIISIAQAYSKVERIYFPVRLDNRTRIYCETDYFDYQKNDLAKGLITFARPGVLTKIDTEAIKYFKAFGGNMYGSGLDKKSLNYRVN